MAVKWTEEQQRVIDVRDRNILVSAAAGSGKTAVLVARILAIITDERKPVDIDRLLVVTFTNAAAAEMRERIRDALELRAEQEPDNIHLQRQLVLVHNAKITTIHSFCLSVLRNHFQAVGIDPGFRVADEGEVILLEQETARETVDDAYEHMDDEFREFLERFTTGKDDQAIEDTVLQLYHAALGQPWPLEWLAKCRERYEASFLEGADWIDYIVEDTARLLEDFRGQIETALRLALEPDGPYPYAKALEADLALIDALRSGSDYLTYAEAFSAMPPFARLGTKRDERISGQKQQQVKAVRDDVKEGLARLRRRYYYDAPETLQREFRESGRIVDVLTKLTESFMGRLSKKKSEKNLVDFGDLEHLALRALVQREDGRTAPTAAAREYAESFEEIMVDEYQDSNLVQELILKSVSGRGRGERNLFMVGDVKQSIYRFRLARPELFMEKYRSYPGAGEESCRIDLHRNFRSRAQVLGGVNFIFRQIMTEHPGGVVYDDDAALYPGASFGESADEDFAAAELWLAQAGGGEERRRREAALVGRRIRALVGGARVWDRDQEAFRPARYGDIVILLRTVSGWADTFGEVLSDMGIPCETGSQKGYFSATEIRTVLAYLQILDNPVQDIPLAAVLRSAIGGFTDEELAMIRAASQERTFYDCCREYQSAGEDGALREKLDRFFAVFGKLRDKCAYTPVHLLLWELLERTGYGAYAAALPAGRQRKANLDMLIEKAIAYEATSYRGLYHFVRYIENLKKYEIDYGEANPGAEAGNAVRIMSIHKSKGLEFPIVFVSGLGKQFNESDLRSRIVIHPDFGVACDYVDEVQRTRRGTLLKRAIQQKTDGENLGEELRVLYVAMTRAKEKLILTGSVSDLESRAVRWRTAARHPGAQLAYAHLASASGYLDWIVPALLRHPTARSFPEPLIMEEETVALQDREAMFTLYLAGEADEEQERLREAGDETARLQELLECDAGAHYDDEARSYLERVFASTYPYAGDAGIPGKLSVSELKRLSRIPEEEDAKEVYREETVIPLIPDFRSGERAITGAARGTVYHAFMENLDFLREEELEIQLEEMISCGKMTEEEGAALDLRDIRAFLRAEIGRRMARAARAGQLYRERPFVLGVPADTIRSDWNPQETVLVQGIIDAYFVEDGRITVLDYKTDRVETLQMLAGKYRVQLDYYAEALRRLTGTEVADRVIYSFHLGGEIHL